MSGYKSLPTICILLSIWEPWVELLGRRSSFSGEEDVVEEEGVLVARIMDAGDEN